MQTASAPVMVRCWQCNGLRPVERRFATRYGNSLCGDCRAGRVVPRTRFHNYWLERFTMEEIEEMARAIWG